MRYIRITLLIMATLFFYNLAWATEYRLTGTVIEQDLKCAGKKANGIDKVAISTNCESGGGPSDDTNNKGEYELKYQCETCINMVIYYEKNGYMPETRRIRSDMTNGSLGDITLRKIEKYSDYRSEDIITLFLNIAEAKIWLDWRPMEKLKKVRAIWEGKLMEIIKDNGPAFRDVKERYQNLFNKVMESLK